MQVLANKDGKTLWMILFQLLSIELKYNNNIE